MTAADRLPPELTAALESARTALAESADGDVPRPLRRRIQAAFGPPQRDAQGRPTGAGYRRRVALEQLLVERVLPIWERRNPLDDRPQRMLGLAEQLLTSDVNPDSATTERRRFLDDLDNAGYATTPGVGYAGSAAANVVATALTDVDAEELDSSLLDEDLDPDMLETDYEASRAAAFDEPKSKFEQDSRSVRRRLREFWDWYLDEAVPKAYAAGG